MMSPVTVGLATGSSVMVVPLWYETPSATPFGPWMIESESAVSELKLSWTMLLLASPLMPKWAPKRCWVSSRSQIWGESNPSPLRSDPA